ncbi:ATP-binding protein [Rhizobiaceae bacterium n13]|uniref:sensor histidine kinase n=1 Tax=Ferirhizobium litorale TaxID=2927786 RepID=UPI0024B2CFAE|nr:histidine kinase dimerization/phosphoacceptor domain -containing protein [Fererhizobium litorale]MDI7865118.1 ATP-binding protein [Fererhizobium litorale]
MSNNPTVHFEAASTLAVVVSSNEPLLFLTDDQKVIAASASFCRAFDIDPGTVCGRRLSELGNGEWAMPKLASLLKATASGSANIEAYEIDLQRPNHKTRQLVVNARTLDDGDFDHVRLLLAVADVTDARAETRLKDDLVRDKAILLQEVQHRVANSLQIIASVLMQSARKVQSEEARGHLRNAHHRVMSIAALQRQLSTSHGGNVELRHYITQLCQSLGASMIADPGRLSIEVTVDNSTVEADVSVSLGLIVTELVINALKHAFPDERTGTIVIDYRSSGKDWTLSIADNGIGMAVGGQAPKTGLGTGIVEALVKNLQAEIRLSDADPGTVVTISHHEPPGLQTNRYTTAEELNGLQSTVPSEPATLPTPIK